MVEEPKGGQGISEIQLLFFVKNFVLATNSVEEIQLERVFDGDCFY